MATYTYSDVGEDVQRRAIDEYRHHEYDAETIRLAFENAYRCRQVCQKLREVALQAYQDGKFADLIRDDNEDLLLVLEYAGLATSNELLKWSTIRDASRNPGA
jgi:hypothetical protein